MKGLIKTDKTKKEVKQREMLAIRIVIQPIQTIIRAGKNFLAMGTRFIFRIIDTTIEVERGETMRMQRLTQPLLQNIVANMHIQKSICQLLMPLTS
jgi:hypothetical protein